MSETMSLLEKTARAIWESNNGPIDHLEMLTAECEAALLHEARAALRALGVTEEQMAGPADAVVVVPVEPTNGMLVAACAVDDAAYVSGSQHGATDEDIYAAMIAARPGAPE